jgi:hypothetical protein
MSDAPDPAPPFFIPRETAAGVRYVRPPEVRRLWRPGPFDGVSLLIILFTATATTTAVVLLTLNWVNAEEWQLALGFAYPLQLALDTAAVARFAWFFASMFQGELELELTAERIRAGKRWGRLWINFQDVQVEDLKRLVVVKYRDADHPEFIWDLVAEQIDGPPVVLFSAFDAPEIIVPLAKDLHPRLARLPELRRRLPALAEEERPTAPPSDRPVRWPMLPGGVYGWAVVHVVGTVGLWQTATLALTPPAPEWVRPAVMILAGLQLFIFVCNFAAWKLNREAAGK